MGKGSRAAHVISERQERQLRPKNIVLQGLSINKSNEDLTKSIKYLLSEKLKVDALPREIVRARTPGALPSTKERSKEKLPLQLEMRNQTDH